MSSSKATSLVVGVPGTTLDPATREVLMRLRPAGFILFKRNCESRTQVERLCADLAALAKEWQPASAPLMFIDQEGGRVNRIGWEPYMAPPGAAIGALYARDPQAGLRAAELNAYVLAAQLAVYGITVDCLPLADVHTPGAHDVIGDRAFSADPAAVAALCAATIKGLLAGGVWPVIKHAPGHGRAGADSHHELPIVTTPAAELATKDFHPFKVNAACPFVMTAHIRYDALDPSACATQSPKVIKNILRDQLGMTGLIVSDDLCMKALGGPVKERAEKALAAGCDLLLHCNGNLEEMAQLYGLPPLTEAAQRRLAALPARGTPQPDVLAAAYAEVTALLGVKAA
jgi:beta-N-acetylhexosaminidase